MPNWPFVPGRSYSRRADIHEKYGGQEQGGIATPAGHNVIFAFTGASGSKHGYADDWQPDGTFHYCGEGQVGDMRLTRGNKAIARHTIASNDLLLFETTGKGKPVRYVGQFVCSGWFKNRLPDRDGDIRDAIIFRPVPLSVLDLADEGAPEIPGSVTEFNNLRARAYAASKASEEIEGKQSVVTTRARCKLIRDYALARAGGNCENCGATAPFITPAGVPFLEVHHVDRISDGGPDSPRAVAAICPNCHREAHYGAQAAQLNMALRKLLSDVEKVTWPLR